MIGRSGERGSGISVLAARHDDEDDDINRRLYKHNDQCIKRASDRERECEGKREKRHIEKEREGGEKM